MAWRARLLRRTQGALGAEPFGGKLQWKDGEPTRVIVVRKVRCCFLVLELRFVMTPRPRAPLLTWPCPIYFRCVRLDVFIRTTWPWPRM